MKKSDLKTGHILKHRNGDLSLLVKDNCFGKDAVIFNEDHWTNFSGFNEDLIWHAPSYGRGDKESIGDLNGSIDVVAVYEPCLPTAFLSRGRKDIFNDKITLIWKCEPKKEMTVAEIEKKLGYSIKIVK